MTRTFCLINQKGGVGKTSSCFHLAGAFAGIGYRVLVVDVDPQGSISQGFFGSSAVEKLGLQRTVAGLFDDDWAFFDWGEIVHPTPFQQIDICPANASLARFNAPCLEDGGLEQFAIREFLEAQCGYDIVLIDCPPNLYRCSWMAMIATDWVVIPVCPEDFGTQGLRAVHQAIENVRLLNPSLRRLGHLVTRSDGRLLVHKFYERRLRKCYGEYVLSNLLPELSAFKVAVADRKPAEFHDNKSRAARLTQNLCRAILDRTDVRNAQRRVADYGFDADPSPTTRVQSR